ncbi:hypothetical protein JB92DRAFT_3106558 [Gautieria morchelliformis]|nr:hypothetical protein JB92DRAFT_3106558 [Gautieria morchelliformis]
MASSLPVVLLFLITLGAMAGAWVLTPKGPQQTYTHTHKSPADVHVLLLDVGDDVSGAAAPFDRACVFGAGLMG